MTKSVRRPRSSLTPKQTHTHTHRLTPRQRNAPRKPLDFASEALAAVGDYAIRSPGSARSVQSYKKGERLGQGTYGVVWRATDRADGRVVALKELRLCVCGRAWTQGRPRGGTVGIARRRETAHGHDEKQAD